MMLLLRYKDIFTIYTLIIENHPNTSQAMQTDLCLFPKGRTGTFGRPAPPFPAFSESATLSSPMEHRVSSSQSACLCCRGILRSQA